MWPFCVLVALYTVIRPYKGIIPLGWAQHVSAASLNNIEMYHGGLLFPKETTRERERAVIKE